MPPFQCCYEGSSAYDNRCKGHSQNQKQFNTERLRNYLFSLSAAHISRVKATWKERERGKKGLKFFTVKKKGEKRQRLQRLHKPRFTGDSRRYIDPKLKN